MLCIYYFQSFLPTQETDRVQQLPRVYQGMIWAGAFSLLRPHQLSPLPKYSLAANKYFHTSSTSTCPPMAELIAFKNAQVGFCAGSLLLSTAASDAAPHPGASLLLQVAKEFPGYQDGEPFPGEQPCGSGWQQLSTRRHSSSTNVK
jgi:hypothetical protein